MIKNITLKEFSDTGMAMTLLSLLFANWFLKISMLNNIAVLFLILTMTFPKLLKPIAFLWFGLSHTLGSVVSKILLSIIFFILVTPIGKIVNLFRKDPIMLHQFKKSTVSVFKTRNHKFEANDLAYPY